MTNRYDDDNNDSTSINASDGLIPQLVYGQTERAGQALGGFLSFLSMYLKFVPTCLSMGKLSRIESNQIDTMTTTLHRSAAFVPTTIEYGPTDKQARRVRPFHCSLYIYFAPTCLSIGKLSPIDTTSSSRLFPLSSCKLGDPLFQRISLTLSSLLLAIAEQCSILITRTKTKKKSNRNNNSTTTW